MKRLNIHIYPSQFKFESRILKITESLITNNIVDEVVILALPGESLPEWETIDEKRKVWRPAFISFGLQKGILLKLLFLAQYILKATFFALRHPVKIVNSHSVNDLPLSYLLSLVTGAKLIYDPHELETEKKGLKRSSQKVYRVVERIFIHKAHHIFVVSDNIKTWYIQRYALDEKRISVVKNIPKSFKAPQANNKFEKLLGLNNTDIKFLYQGGLFTGRGLPILLEAFSKVDQDKHLIIMGYGELERIVEDYSKKFSNIHYVPAVPPSEVLSYSCSADVGIALIENICLSYYYCMPNKLYEYYLAGIPSIVSNFPDMSEFVQAAQCGWTVNVDANEFKNLINNISKEEIDKVKLFIRQSNNKLSWITEESKLITPYSSI
ncbi:glycosyltransferase [Pontibacter anaerobius]|uniref:Glycosyltransferase n=1 Tax=Pontibacter anaerobius TaxID=2993940 RepID=A0ABT3RJ20_9BACT|nr:glycosyltransferase [Pontibacter anaerobius]MCX2741555.1 glycosyltransferase [Pontibacter anaerobius]